MTIRSEVIEFMKFWCQLKSLFKQRVTLINELLSDGPKVAFTEAEIIMIDRGHLGQIPTISLVVEIELEALKTIVWDLNIEPSSDGWLIEFSISNNQKQYIVETEDCCASTSEAEVFAKKLLQKYLCRAAILKYADEVRSI